MTTEPSPTAANGPTGTASTLNLRIVGMTCGACVSRVERALRSVEGVRDATVNLMTESARVSVAPEGSSGLAQLVDAVRRAGYDAEPMPTGRASLQGDPAQREQLRRHRQNLIQAAMYALPIIALDHFGPHLQGHHAAGALGWRLLQAALVVLLLLSSAGAPILVGGLRAAWHRAPNMDLLITAGVLAAVAGSLAGTLLLRPEFIHFHAAAMILLLVNVGRYLEARARGSAASAMSALARRAASAARVQRGAAFVETAVEDVAVGDLVQLLPHAAIPIDAEIVEGRVSVDESLLTGEPLPVTREPGMAVQAGTLVVEGVAVARATQVGRASALGRIVELVRQAQASRTQMQRLADQVAAVFTPIVIALAVATFAAWLGWGGTARLAPALAAAIAVLVVACPCAMGLATPTAVLVASSQAALRGILVRDAASLEALGRIDTVVWDKTGTLTAGRPSVTRVDVVPDAFTTLTVDAMEDALLRLAAAAEQFSPHPLARAIVAEARRRGLDLPEPADFESVPGRGVQATVNQQRIVVGGIEYLAEQGIAVDALAPFIAAAQDGSVAAVAVDGRAAGLIVLQDAPRPSASAAIARLARLGVTNFMLTGDARSTALAVAEQVSIAQVRAGVDPQGKADFVRELRGQGRRVAMIGDGINDAAALAEADVGVAFATGADVAVASAGINLIGSTPHLVADAVELSRASVRIIRQNLFWAFFYNLLMIPLAALGRLPPDWAAGAMMLSSLTVVLNALRLRTPARHGPPR